LKRLAGVLALALATAPAVSLACIEGVPATPPSLEVDAARADAILVVHVIGVREFEGHSKADQHSPRIAIDFVVIETLKGDLREPGVAYVGLHSCSAMQPMVGRDYLLSTVSDSRSGRDVVVRNERLTHAFPSKDEISQLKLAIHPSPPTVEKKK
jgi:hypothetical protein